jgi:hypothetical protein
MTRALLYAIYALPELRSERDRDLMQLLWD